MFQLLQKQWIWNAQFNSLNNSTRCSTSNRGIFSVCGARRRCRANECQTHAVSPFNSTSRIQHFYIPRQHRSNFFTFWENTARNCTVKVFLLSVIIRSTDIRFALFDFLRSVVSRSANWYSGFLRSACLFPVILRASSYKSKYCVRSISIFV